MRLKTSLNPISFNRAFCSARPVGRVLTPLAFSHIGLAVPGGLESAQASLFQEYPADGE